MYPTTYHLAVVGHWVLPIVVGHEGMAWSYDVIGATFPTEESNQPVICTLELKGDLNWPTFCKQIAQMSSNIYFTRPLFDPERFVAFFERPCFLHSIQL